MLAILGPLTIASAGLRNSGHARDQITAFYLAQEGIEFVRFVRDDNYLRFLSSSDDGIGWIHGLEECMVDDSGDDPGCVVDIPFWFSENGNITDDDVIQDASDQPQMYIGEFMGESGYTYQTNGTGDDVPARYTRVIKIKEETDPNEIKITSTISWNTRDGGVREFTLTEQLFNIYNQ